MYDIEKLKEEISFTEVFRNLFPDNWKESGKNHLCPFHSDKSPSFSIKDEKKRGYCYSSECNDNWDIIDFVKKAKDCDIQEAIKFLIDNHSPGFADIKHERPSQEKYNNVECNNLNNLQDVLQERGVLEEISSLIRSNIIECDGTIIFVPLLSFDNKIIGKQKIGLLKDKENGRYVYEKKSDAKNGFFTLNPDGTDFVVVESFLDGVSTAKKLPNYKVVVNFTADGEKVSRILKDTTEQIIIFFDNDPAGQKATKETAELMCRTIKTVDWSIAKDKGNDANELLINDPDLIIKLIDNALVVNPFDNVMNAQRLIFSELPEPSFIVKGILPEGMSILAGKPKRGKSFLALNIAKSCASGGKALGNIHVKKQKVLYLALEDTPRRLKRRLSQSVPDDAMLLDNLHLAIEWPRIGQGCENKLEMWLKHHPDTKLIIIDTLEKIAPAKSMTKGIYSDDYSKIEPLKAIADKYNIAIVCIHHLNKRDSDSDEVDRVSGSTGLTGAVDTILILNRDINRADAKLYISGRDLEENELGINFDKTTGNWTIIGKAEDLKLPEKQNEIYKIIRDSNKPLSPNDILWEFARQGVDKRINTIQSHLRKMLKKGTLNQPYRGYYCVSDLKI